MKSSELVSVLEGHDEFGALRTVIEGEIAEYRDAISKRGSSRPVYIESIDVQIELLPIHVQKLCEEFLEGRLDEVEMSYVASALALCPDFSMSPRIEEAVTFLAELAEEPLTSSQVREIRDSLWESK